MRGLLILQIQTYIFNQILKTKEVCMTNLYNQIKSVRIFEKGGIININYITVEGDRKRFSTGIKATKQHRVAIERKMHEKALAHYEAHKASDTQTLFKDVYLTASRSTADNRGEDTQLDYEGLLNRDALPIFGMMPIGSIKPMHIEQWKANIIKKGISKSRFHKHWSALSMVFQYCVKNEIIAKDPMAFVQRNSKAFKTTTSSADKYYTQSEVALILKHSTEWFRAFIHVLFLTGVRTGEALALQWSHVDFEKRQLTIEYSVKKAVLKTTKTGKTRVVDMSSNLYDELKAHYENRLSDTFVFPSYKTLKPYHGSNAVVRHYFKPLLKELNIEYKTLYATRHSFASNLVQNNAPITFVQKMLGHSKLTTTMDFYVKNGLIDSSEMAPILDKLYSA